MTKTQAWIRSLRLRTLPLSSAGAILGAALAYKDGYFNWSIAALCLLTVLLLQILSNMANDLGDSQKGTDNDKRVGPQRAVQSGLISQKEMKQAIILMILLSLLSGLSLLFYSFKQIDYSFLLIFLIGILGIVAAIKYTVGKKAYGYYGLGDIFVFFFFGWIPVSIAYFVQIHTWNWLILLPGLSVGLLSMAVLNLNNLRDIENDRIAGKKTLIVSMGVKKGIVYHTTLLLGAFASAVSYTILTYKSYFDLLYLFAFLPLLLHLLRVFQTKNTKNLDPELKKVAISTILLVLLWTIGFILS